MTGEPRLVPLQPLQAGIMRGVLGEYLFELQREVAEIKTILERIPRTSGGVWSDDLTATPRDVQMSPEHVSTITHFLDEKGDAVLNAQNYAGAGNFGCPTDEELADLLNHVYKQIEEAEAVLPPVNWEGGWDDEEAEP